MEIIPMLLKEMEQEAQNTRKMFERIPNDKYDWQPHLKSMTIRQLATHIAELPAWVTMALTTDGLDFAANPYNPEVINNNDELMAYFEKTYADGKAHLEKTNEEELAKSWILRNGEQVIFTYTKGETVRVAFNQTVHHRAQMGVNLRLLDRPVPGSYGPSADESF